MVEDGKRKREPSQRTIALLYGPVNQIEKGFRIEDFVKPGYLVLVEGYWQRVRDVIVRPSLQGSVLITEYGARVSLDGPPPESFRYREPSGLPVADLARRAVILGALGLVAAIVAAVASVMALFKH